jgi:copper(I)-binding protein
MSGAGFRIARGVMAATLLVAAATAQAAEYRLGALVVAQPWVRASPPGASAAAGFLTIRNGGAAAARLVSVTAEFAAQAQIHEMKMSGDVMQMRPVENGLEIAPGATIELAPGGHHLMFMGLKGKLQPGGRQTVRLVFETLGEIAVEFSVEPVGAKAPSN